jgi:FixJ family two-component response regulator
MSGYTADAIVHRGMLEKGVVFISKPFTINALIQKVREALENKI